MLQVNYIKSFINALKSRGWVIQKIRGYGDLSISILERINKKLLIVESINVDMIGSKQPQVEAFFLRLIDILKNCKANEIIFQGGGEIEIPYFFISFCKEHDIEIKILTVDTIHEINNY